jgi:hypothetical protein
MKTDKGKVRQIRRPKEMDIAEYLDSARSFFFAFVSVYLCSSVVAWLF